MTATTGQGRQQCVSQRRSAFRHAAQKENPDRARKRPFCFSFHFSSLFESNRPSQVSARLVSNGHFAVSVSQHIFNLDQRRYKTNRISEISLQIHPACFVSHCFLNCFNFFCGALLGGGRVLRSNVETQGIPGINQCINYEWLFRQIFLKTTNQQHLNVSSFEIYDRKKLVSFHSFLAEIFPLPPSSLVSCLFSLMY